MELLTFVPVAVAIVAGLVQVVKRATHLPEDVVPMLEVGVGIALVGGGTFTGAVHVVEADARSEVLFWSLIYGTIAGLTSAGLYKYGETIGVSATKRANGGTPPSS